MTAPSAFPHCPALPPPLPMLIAAAALLLGGCMSLAPSYEAPQAPEAERYAAEDLGRADGGVQAAALAWRSYFTEPRLQQLIAQALENSRDLRSATLRVAEAQALPGIQRAAVSPTVAATADGARGRTPADLSPTGRAVTASQYQAGLGLASWELDFWGRVRSLRDAALENYLATDEARRAVSVSLVAQLANAYFALRELDERLALARQTVANRQEAVRIFTRRFEVGAIARTDLVQTETLLHQAQSLAAQLGQLRALQLHALSLLVGMPLPELAQPGTLDDQAIDFKVMVHAIHAGAIAGYKVCGYGNTGYDFSHVRYPGRLNNCEGCHLPDTYYPPDSTVALATTFDAGDRSTPLGDVATTPATAVCSVCHPSQDARNHMLSSAAGGSVTAVKDAASRTPATAPETCATCHGPGKDADVKKVHGVAEFNYN